MHLFLFILFYSALEFDSPEKAKEALKLNGQKVGVSLTE